MTKGTQICGTNRTGYIVIPAHAHFFLSVTILMAAMSLIQLGMAQEVKVTAPSFKYQHKNGTLDLDLSCSIHGLYAFYNPEVESCFFEIRPPTGKAISARKNLSKRISSWQPETCAAVLSVQEPAMDPQGQSGMDPIGQVWAVSSNEGPMHFSIPHAWIKEGYDIKCRWNYYGCPRSPRLYGEQRAECMNRISEKTSIQKSGTVNAALRIAKILLPPPSQGLVNGPVSIEIGKPLILDCSIQNLEKFGDHACEWTFSASDSRANISTIDRETFSKPLVSAKFGRDKLQLFSSSWKEYCRLNIAQTQFAHEGNWTCAPGNGTDGWINPSSPVEVKIAVNACTDNNECNGGGRNPELVCQVPSSLREAGTDTKLCIPVCDTVEGSQVCGNLTNAHCQYDAASSDGVRCSCHPGFISDTGFFQNRTRCVKKCTYDTDCLGNEVCFTGRTTHRCLPICELYSCGENALCNPSKATRYRTCSCEDGTYPNDTSLGAESGCRAARFPGLRMLLLEDSGSTSRQECEGKEENGTKSCTFNVSEQANVSFICDASQTFPEPYLNVTTKHGNSSVHLTYAGETSIPNEGELHHEDPLIADMRSEPVPDGAIKARLWNVSKADHNGAIITCHLSSEAHIAQVHVALTVGAHNSGLPSSKSENGGGEPILLLKIGVGILALLLFIAIIFIITTTCIQKWRKQRTAEENSDATVAMTSLSTHLDGTRSDTNATSLRSARALYPKVWNRREGHNKEPIYEDIDDKGPSTAGDGAGRQGIKSVGLRLQGNEPCRFHMDAVSAATGVSELPPNILPQKHVRPANLLWSHSREGNTYNEEPSTSEGQSRSTITNSRHERKRQNDLSRQPNPNSSLAGTTESEYATVLG